MSALKFVAKVDEVGHYGLEQHFGIAFPDALDLNPVIPPQAIIDYEMEFDLKEYGVRGVSTPIKRIICEMDFELDGKEHKVAFDSEKPEWKEWTVENCVCWTETGCFILSTIFFDFEKKTVSIE